MAQNVKHLPAIWETCVRSLGWEDALKKEVATHSSILGWKIPRTGEPGWPQSKESVTTEKLHFHFSLLRDKEGRVKEICSCLENPRHGGA